jgi:hypothetical protein
MPDQIDDRTTVRALLQVSGLRPSGREIDQFVAAYPRIRAMVHAIYELPGTRYEEPAVTFDPRVDPA